MPSVLGDFALALATHQWQATLIGSLGLICAVTLRRRAPRAASVVLLLALAKFVLPSFVSAPFALADRAAAWARPFDASVLTATAGQPAGRWWLAALLAVWAAGSVTVWASWWWRRTRLRAIARAGLAPVDGPLPGLARSLARRLGMRGTPAIVLAPVDGPYATGVRHRVIVLPDRCADHLGIPALEVVLAHELLHHRRHDLLASWFAAVVVGAAWFNPVVWGLSRAWRSVREDCCDDDLIRAGIADADCYADTLLAVAAVSADSARAGMRTAGHPLKRRLARLLLRRNVPGRHRLAVAATALVFGAGAVPFSHARPLMTPPDDGVRIRVVRTVRRPADVRIQQETVERRDGIKESRPVVR